MVGIIGPFGSGLPQLGLPRLFATGSPLPHKGRNRSFSVMFPFYRKLLFPDLLQDWYFLFHLPRHGTEFRWKTFGVTWTAPIQKGPGFLHLA